MKKDQSFDKYKVVLVLALVALAIWTRFMPHPANFTALTAVALFGGALLPRRLSIVVPLAAMIISDLFIGMHSLSLVVWASFALVAVLGGVLRNKQTPLRIALSSIAGSTLFFIITNFAVWAEGRMYVMNLAGLVQSYVNALPFYRNMLAGDLLYAGLLFGAYAAIVYGVKVMRNRRELVVNA